MNDPLTTDVSTIANKFVSAIADGDRGALLGILAPEVTFRALTPGMAWEADSAEEAVETLVGIWFGGERHVDSVESVETGTVADVLRVGYRFRATTPDGPSVIEQQAYLAVADDTITSVRLVCSGFQPATN